MPRTFKKIRDFFGAENNRYISALYSKARS